MRLGRSGLKVSPIAFGSWELGGDVPLEDEEAALSTIRQVADMGVTIFDTAQAYGFGTAERALGRALRGGYRDRVILATKGGLRRTDAGSVRDCSPAWVRQGVEASLQALETEWIDLYQVHWPDENTPFEETADELIKLVKAGKIRHVGVSNFNSKQCKEFSALLPIETLQFPYSMLHRDSEAGILPYAGTNDIGVLVYGPIAHGLLSGALKPDHEFGPRDWRSRNSMFKGDAFQHNLQVVSELDRFARNELDCTVSQLAVAWTLAHSDVHVAIVGSLNAKHVADAVAAAEIRLDQASLDRVDDIVRTAIPFGGPSPDGRRPRDGDCRSLVVRILRRAMVL